MLSAVNHGKGCGEGLPVYVYAGDPVSASGVAGLIGACGAAVVVADIDAAQVAVVVADEVNEETIRVLAGLPRQGCPRVVLIVSRLDDAGLLSAIERGVAGILYREEADVDEIRRALWEVSAGHAFLPPDATARLMSRMGDLQREVLAPRHLHPSGLSEREIEVLRLMAEGFDTAMVAERLCYSERTVKNVLHDVTQRFHLRNRTQAVVFALRKGLI